MKPWYYVISASGALVWMPAIEPGAPPAWLDGACWHGTVEARSAAEARAQVERLRQVKHQAWSTATRTAA